MHMTCLQGHGCIGVGFIEDNNSYSCVRASALCHAWIVMQSRERCVGMVNNDMKDKMNVAIENFIGRGQAGPQRGVGGE